MELNGTTGAILIGVWATFALDVFSTVNSSPQTTELFAGDREESLMYWVKVGALIGVGGGAVASLMSGKPWPLLATVIVSAGMFLMYRKAVQRGTADAQLDTLEG